MSEKTEKTNEKVTDRRGFLRLAGASAATATSAAVTAAPLAAAPRAAKPGEGPLYRETDHVRRYYELAR